MDAMPTGVVDLATKATKERVADVVRVLGD
jgi:hypothetical protein